MGIKLRRKRWAGQHVAHMGIEECIQEFGGKPEEMRPLRRPRHR